LVVHDTRCDGAVLATMPLPDPKRGSRRFSLDASLPPLVGQHALCLVFTAPIDGPLYALGHVTLEQTPMRPASTQPAKAGP
jgi:hexosaminidase